MRFYLKILKALNNFEKKRLILIAFLTLLSTLFELFSVVLTIPIIKLIYDNEFYNSFSNSYSNYIPDLIDTKANVLFVIVILYLLIYI